MGWLSRLRAGLRSRSLRWLSLYPPYLGAGIRVEQLPGPAYRVRMVAGFFNRNYYGTHFGGSLYSMCDPFFTLILAERLGRGYEVWDKAATIRFRRPGRGTVEARFAISDERLDEVRAAADRDGTAERSFEVEVTNSRGQVVAEVEKLVHVRKRERTRREDQGPGSSS